MLRHGFRTAARVALACVLVNLFLQGPWAHRVPAHLPAEPVSLAPLLERERLSAAEDETLFLHTGLSPAAVGRLLAQGEAGEAQILETQAALAAPRPAVCQSLIPGRVTCEDLLSPTAARVPLAPLEPGELLVTFSTHTAGWRHGHAGLAVGGGAVLEAARLGQRSGRHPSERWSAYSNFLVLRVRNAPAEARTEAVRFALEHLDDAPYSFFAGLGPRKLPEHPDKVQCAYLPWSAWMHCGYDLDDGGGWIVTVADLAASPLLEVVQVCGLDPAPFLSRMAPRAEDRSPEAPAEPRHA